MISNVHYVELYINNQLMELESQESLRIRINNVLFDPTKTSTTQAEYSFSFDIPSTPNNDKVLDYANNLSKLNKFHTRYQSEVYADGNLIFNGSLTIRKYDAKEKMYECNLVSFKINTLEDIFDDDVLTDVKWEEDFDGADSIETANFTKTEKYWFPFVSYGAFQKDQTNYGQYPNSKEYTSMYQIDNQNRFYMSSFYPSLNMLEEAKKCFEYKGYNVGGTAFNDPILSNIYCSTNLADGQSPTYNVGYEKFGKLEITVGWGGNPDIAFKDEWTGEVNLDSGIILQDLKFPYFGAEQAGTYYDFVAGTSTNLPEHWNYDHICMQSMLDYGRVTMANESTMLKMYGSRSRAIVIPADGFYKISLSGNTRLLQTDKLQANQYVHEWNGNVTAMTITATTKLIEFNPDFAITTPIEIQLIKNYDDNVELIKGKNNIFIHDGYPDNTTEMNKGRYTNYSNYISCYPHEKAGINASQITKDDAISDTSYNRSDANIGYVYGNNELHCYDPVVSNAFICGFTTMGNKNGGGCVSFIKDGYSWSKTYSDKTDAMYQQQGYFKLWTNDYVTISSARTNTNANTLANSPSCSFSQYNTACTASVNGIVYLKKGDVLDLVAVRRGYTAGSNELPISYYCDANVKLTIEAASPKNIFQLRANNYGWTSPTEFPTKLNLMEFTNKETKISDWLKNIQNAFNLLYEFNGNSVDININKGIKKTISNAIDIDDRVSSDEAESEYISYPKSMSVKYKIDTDEHGFYESVPYEHINESDWKNWGDSGFTIIQLNDDSYETSSQNKTTQFSYCWYDSDFKIVDKYYVADYTGETITNLPPIPVIAKEEYMIDGLDYGEAESHRGYGLPQRFWFRQTTPVQTMVNSQYKPLWIPIQDDCYESEGRIIPRKVRMYLPTNQKDGFNLSYKDTETSLVTEYFNIHPMLDSNYVKVETFLNPEEYIQIKGGALVHFDSDLYYTSEISGYDPSGYNTTQLKLIKKT